MRTLEEQASAAMARGEVTKESSPSKQDALRAISQGRADAMSVAASSWGETVQMQHYTVRFNDRDLGRAARSLSLTGFGLEDTSKTPLENA